MIRSSLAWGFLVALILAGCSNSNSVVTSNPPTNVWAGNRVIMGESPSPAFPPSLTGWRLSTSWSDLTRVFSDEGWRNLSGPENTGFPSTMNGCGDQRFLARWRAIDSTAKLQVGIVGGGSVTANAGWLGFDGCETPRIQVVSFEDGATLTDVTIDIQRWTPAP